MTTSTAKASGNFFATLLSQVISLGVSFYLVRLYTSSLTVAEFGLFSLIVLIPEFLTPVIFLEITSGFSKFYQEFKSKGIYFSVVTLLVGVFVLFSVLFYIFSFLIEPMLLFIESFKGITVRQLYLAFCSSFSIYLFNLNLTKFKLDYSYKAIFSSTIVVNILKPLAVLFFMSQYKDPIFAILFGLSFAHFMTFMLYLPFSLKGAPLSLNLNTLKSSLNFSKWFVPGAYFGVVINFMDRFFLAHFVGLAEVGVYSLAYKIGDLIKQFFINAFGAVLLPLKFSEANSGIEFAKKMNQLFSLYIIFGLALVLGINSVSEIFIHILGGASYASAVLVVPFILVGHISFGLIGFLNTGYLVTGRSKYGLATLAIGSIVNLILNLLLIPKLGAIGAAVATLVSFVATLPVAYYYACKFHDLRFNFKAQSTSFVVFLIGMLGQVIINVKVPSMYLSSSVQLVIVFIFSLIMYFKVPLGVRQTLIKKLF